MNSDPPLTPEQLGYLAQFDTPTICNVIELFGIRSTLADTLDGSIQANFPDQQRLVGYAATATFCCSRPAVAPDPYSYMDQQIAAFEGIPTPRVGVFQDLDSPPVGAAFGEVTCTFYKAFGFAGIITNGAGRDLDQVESLGFPVFTSQAIATHGHFHFEEMNLPVRVGGLRVCPGDLLHGDRNGVTIVPAELAEILIGGCRELLSEEQRILKLVDSNGLDLEKVRKAEDECIRRLDALGKRLRTALEEGLPSEIDLR